MLYNLREYHRPADVEEALQLLRRTDIHTVAIAGGTAVVGEGTPEIEAVVDLAALGLDFIEHQGNLLRLGATLTLQNCVTKLGHIAGGLLSRTAHRMAGWNIRNAATLGGMLAGGDLHSPLSVALAALRATLEITGSDDPVPWPSVTKDVLSGQLITAVRVTLPAEQISAAYEQVGRTPADAPIVCAAAIAYQVSGEVKTRIAVGGVAADDLLLSEMNLNLANPIIHPIMAITDDLTSVSILSDFLGSSDYRLSIAPVLARRALTGALAGLGITVEG